MSLSQRQMEGDLCTAEAPWEKPDASSPCNTLPRVGGEGRNPPVSKCSLCNSETWNSSPVWPTAHYISAAGWLNGDPHGGTAGWYQKLVCMCQCPVLVQVTSSSCRLSVLVCLLGIFYLFTLAAMTIHSDAGEKPSLNQLCWSEEPALPAG